MTRSETEHWLAGLQARFSAVLRTPLSAAGGALHADARAYPRAAIDDILPSSKLTAAERLGVYQRQYWMRLLRLLQEQYPLTTRLCGAWDFNQRAIAFLCRHAPHGSDLASVAEGFEPYLENALREDPLRIPGVPPLPRDALQQAARLDAAFRRVFMAPAEPTFLPSAGDTATLSERRVRMSRALARVDEAWPLLELRARTSNAPSDGPIALPAPLARRRSWAIFRTDRGVTHLELERDQARLLELLQDNTLGGALAILESECDPAGREKLPARTQRFLAEAVRRGFFSGLA